ncbi:MAG: T9SS type A sorting domain-containing protein, partial [Chloroflexota bacterium]
YTFCKLDVKQVTDSAFVMVTHNWVAPDSLWIPQSGLTLSTSHYWTIEGVFPDGFNATGVFNYNRNVLDADIITSSGDSLVILYRPDAGHNWQSVGFTRTGPWQIGNIYVDNLRPGQYTLAVWDEEYVGYNTLPMQKILNVYPNPSKGEINIQTSHKTATDLVIQSTDGRTVFHYRFSAAESLRWKGVPGNYLISLYESNNKLATMKAIIN